MSNLSSYTERLFNWKSLTKLDIFLIVAFIAIVLGKILVSGSVDMLSTISALAGVICVVLGAKGSLSNWIFGIIECGLYAYICFSSHIYGDGLQRLFYTLPMQFVGWYMWSHRRSEEDPTIVHTRLMTWRQRGLWLVAIAALTTGVGLLLTYFSDDIQAVIAAIFGEGNVKEHYTSQTQLYMDALTTVVMMVAMWMSTQAYAEQWALWIGLNVFSVLIWMQNLGTDQYAFMTMSKYILYFINSIYGLINWTRLARK